MRLRRRRCGRRFFCCAVVAFCGAGGWPGRLAGAAPRLRRALPWPPWRRVRPGACGTSPSAGGATLRISRCRPAHRHRPWRSRSSGTGKPIVFCWMFIAATTICLPLRMLSNSSLVSSSLHLAAGRGSRSCIAVGSACSSSILICTPAGHHQRIGGRHPDQQLLLLLAFDLAHGGGDQHHAGIGLEALRD